MKYSDKTTLDYKVGDIVYVKLSENTISQARFNTLTTKIYYRSGLQFSSIFTLDLPNGNSIEHLDYKDVYSNCRIYATEEDVKNDVRILFFSELGFKKFNDELIKFLAIRKVAASEQCLGNYYKTGVQIKKYGLEAVYYNHGVYETEYEYTVIVPSGYKNIKCTEKELNKKGCYLTEEEAREHSDIKVLKFEEPKEKPKGTVVKIIGNCSKHEIFVNDKPFIKSEYKDKLPILHKIIDKIAKESPDHLEDCIFDFIDGYGCIVDSNYNNENAEFEFIYELDI